MVQYLHSLVLNGKFDEITHQLPVRGHSYLPCDRDFGIIERMQRRRDHIEMYTGWNGVIKERFDLTPMKGLHMRDSKGTLGKYYKASAKNWKITKMKVLNYNAVNKLQVTGSEDMNAHGKQSFHLLKPPYTHIPYPTTPLYIGPCQINPKKIKDVQALARYLGDEARQHMNSLVGSAVGDVYEDSDYEH